MARNQTREEFLESCRKARERSKERQHIREQRIKETSDLPYSFTYKIRNAFIGKPCPICGRRMGVSDNEFRIPNPYPSVQHNIPISKGGTNTIENISVICRSCNSSIRNNVTGDLNNAEVRKVWARINELHQTG